MTEYFIVYDAATGDVLWRGSGPAGATAQQELAEGLAVIEVPQAAVRTAEVDIDAIRTMLAARIDAAAEVVRQQIITPGAGQVMTYQRKEAEARAWTSGADPAGFPFLVAEAFATDVTIDELAAIVIASADQWIVIGSAIEGTRLGAKKAVRDAANIAELASAAAVNWMALLAP